jgi:hypothetical protein
MELLDGTNALIDFQLDYPGTSNVSLKCAFAYMSCDIVREFTEKTTFCSDGWRSRQPGMKQCVGRLDGFASKASVYSDPLALFADNDPKDFLFTADSGCTIGGQLHIARDHIGLRAAANSERGIDWESYGEVTSSWVVA